MVYYFKYMSKNNHDCNISVLINNNEKKFYVWKPVLYSGEKEKEVSNNRDDFSVILVKTKADIAGLIKQLRNDNNFMEI